LEIKLTRKQIWISVLLFVINAAALLGIAFFMLLLNKPQNTLLFVVQEWERVVFVLASVLLLLVLTFGYLYFECREILTKPAKQQEMFLLFELSLVLSALAGRYLDANARPFGFFAIMCAILLGRKQAMFLNTVNAILLFILDINISLDINLEDVNLVSTTWSGIWTYCAGLLISFCAGTLVVFISHRIKTRLQSLMIFFILLIPIELIIGIMEILFMGTESIRWELLGYGALGAFLSTLCFMLFLPLFELVFAEITTFRLREITSPNAPLMKRLKEEAPGTFNHSVVVSQLAEACALAIGDDSEFARAAAYYHDVGKLKNPDYFTENQAGVNPHNELPPELSADIIRSHTRDGAKLIKKQHLPDFLAEVAVQHHGTLPIKYFYAKALKMTDGEISMADFSYPGPVPRSRTAAIIMIADASEAASRSLADRSEANIEKLCGNIIEERINLDQFSECNITMRDLTIISHTIAQSLSGVYHKRIAYPKLKIGKNNK